MGEATRGRLEQVPFKFADGLPDNAPEVCPLCEEASIWVEELINGDAGWVCACGFQWVECDLRWVE